MREPHFWRDIDPRSRAAAPLTRALLTPFAAAYAWAGQRRIKTAAAPFDPGVPVICIGNLTLGGAGKTPVSAYIRDRLAQSGKRAATLSRGYRGKLKGPVRVDSGTHSARDVGDEPLMLSRSGEAWIARDRAQGAAAMVAAGVEAIVMDDGHQNPAVNKSLSLVVIDASEPFGNGHVFPKGPLREPVGRGLARADAIILMGEGTAPAAITGAAIPVFRARLTVLTPPEPGNYVAFAGIGQPARFFSTLESIRGVTLSEAISFADHHAYTATDISIIEGLAERHAATLITTEKDMMRLPVHLRDKVTTLPVGVVFDEPESFHRLLDDACTRHQGSPA